jgi:plasmid stabilization system protein ParE
MPTLHLSFTTQGREEITEIGRWLAENFEGAAQRFSETIDTVLPALCQDVAEQIATGGRPATLPDERGSLFFSRPVSEYIFTTQKKRNRRSTSGIYRVFYELLDADKDGQVDTLRVLSVRHAGAKPLWDVDSTEFGGTSSNQGESSGDEP